MAAFKVLGESIGPESKFRLVVVPIWTTAVAANDATFKEQLK